MQFALIIMIWYSGVMPDLKIMGCDDGVGAW
jgi:hypothetical protein